MEPVSYVPHRSARVAHRALQDSIRAQEQAQRCAVLWFGDILQRKLYRDLGFASINQYAQQALGFSKTRTGDFVQLARKLEKLPAVRESVARGELGYTKAREVVKVAGPTNELAWVDVAKASSRRELESKVARAKRQAAAKPEQTELLADEGSRLPKASPPVRVSVNMTPEQFARFEKLMEKLGRGGDKAELVLEGLAALAEEPEKAPRGAPFQIHLHECPTCRAATVPTSKGDLAVDRATVERAHCDGRLDEPGRPNRATIPPAKRRQVLARDRHRCRTPGCHHTRFLEVHHITARSQGGSNNPDNLITLCSACHQIWHEKRGSGPPPRMGPN